MSPTNTLSESLKITVSNWGFHGIPSQSSWDWNLSLNIKNTGNTNAVINNIAINGQSYSSFNPIPTVNPPIKNGYALSPNQDVTITIQGTNTSTVPTFHKDSVINVETVIGNSYSTLLGS